jgi:hypothetical protein
VAVGCAGGAGTDGPNRPVVQAADGGERQRHRADVIGNPALVAGASGRVALHRAGQVDAERLRRELQCRLRDECLNETLFTSKPHARAELARWRRDYNTVRPHSKFGGKTPAEIAGERVRGHAPGHVAINSNNQHEGTRLYL